MTNVEHIESPGYRAVLRNMYPIVKRETWRETVRRKTEAARKNEQSRTGRFYTGGPV